MSSLEDDLVAVADAWAEAIVANDADLIAAYTAEEWVLVSADGVLPGADFLALVASGELTHSAMRRVGPARVRRHGDTAVLTARVTNTAWWHGTRHDADEWTTDVFTRAPDDRWLCVLTHLTPAAGAGEGLTGPAES